MEPAVSFRDYAVVACGTMSPELNYLRATGFLDVRKVLYTKPGLHQEPLELERQLVQKIGLAKTYASKIIVVYGGKYCYINTADPYRHIDTILEEQKKDGISISRINAEKCVDMLTTSEEREAISRGEKMYWLTPGWLKYRFHVFKDWDKATANTNFPQYTGGAVLLDPIGFFNRYTAERPEELLDFCDWMGIPLEPSPVTLKRLKKLLAELV